MIEREVKAQIRESLPSPFNQNYITIFCDASWINPSVVYGLGFTCVTNLGNIIITVASSTTTNTCLQAEIETVQLALTQCKQFNITSYTSYFDCMTKVDSLNLQNYISFEEMEDINNPMGNLEHWPNIN